jgi:hypothetical protein
VKVLAAIGRHLMLFIFSVQKWVGLGHPGRPQRKNAIIGGTGT